MEIIEIINEAEGLSLRQRWANVFTIVTCIALMILGLNLRARTLTATVFYASPEAGISGLYPQNWLLDTRGDYVFRVRDMSRTGFKTTFLVSIQPVGDDAEERNLADRLSLDRITAFTDYRVQPLVSYDFADGREAQALAYTYVASDVSPFLNGVPTVIRGLDVLTIRGGQAVVVSLRADANDYDAVLPQFNRFLNDLQF